MREYKVGDLIVNDREEFLIVESYPELNFYVLRNTKGISIPQAYDYSAVNSRFTLSKRPLYEKILREENNE